MNPEPTRRPSPPRRAAPPAAGFTLVEVLVVAVVLGVAVVGLTQGLQTATLAHASSAEQREITAHLLGREVLELAQALAREPSGELGATRAEDVLALDSLIGASFRPPLRANRTQDESLPGWRQDVELLVYALDDLETPTGEAPWSQLSRQAERVLELRVTVLHEGEGVETFSWWITP